MEVEKPTSYPPVSITPRSAGERVKLSRHPERPLTSDYITYLFPDFIELKGDRLYGNDASLIAGLATFQGLPVTIIGHEKGRGTRDKIMRNFGMSQPEGYRKALRLMKQAEKFGRPIITFIDTPGAYPGLEAEERGVAEAIARNLLEMAGLRTIVLSVVIGEGGSGGALGIGVSDRLFMLENAYYSVITPEGCASILWKDASKWEEAAASLKITADELLRLGVIDEIFPEPLEGAHTDLEQTVYYAGRRLAYHLDILLQKSMDEILEERYARLRRLGEYNILAE
ncbi:acetyl-CoA carboxylase carboxyltransferase subunit alpha [Aneurinibacillus uraniidurans]|uniref:acetyl-CoA carboxylase carboxyltransferase subunit alpha n=1 Tax=Aneurinibacillus uraniidurans TaxID=2966586 RepID=UPI00234AB247|nr:acetyl-CoA carboxylase carboxyltransferase subunit alpha [Aneurinibacillus sp. B1]WCN37026.1 acetyl-CoA carboxylase carboxyltransferase subunit alpha [Aneurinibacillus sp. B1]